MARLLFAAAIAFVVNYGPAWADDLGDTSWDTVNDACNIDGIDFYSDGTADIYDFVNDDEDTGHWHMEGSTLTVEYDNWYGGIEGTVLDGKRIEATETWQDDETNEMHHDPCIFEIEQPDNSPSPPGNQGASASPRFLNSASGVGSRPRNPV